METTQRIVWFLSVYNGHLVGNRHSHPNCLAPMPVNLILYNRVCTQRDQEDIGPICKPVIGNTPGYIRSLGRTFYYSADTKSYSPALCRIFYRLQRISWRNSISRNDIPADRKHHLRGVEH